MRMVTMFRKRHRPNPTLKVLLLLDRISNAMGHRVKSRRKGITETKTNSNVTLRKLNDLGLGLFTSLPIRCPKLGYLRA